MVILLVMILVGLGGAVLFRVIESRAHNHPIGGASTLGVLVLVAALAVIALLYQLG